ncbi:MAG: M18 family aminopeptidase [Gammaproteobacteria bacterium]|nr:M18 family aminopeptidase [Pseudomonadales bacterium]MCP5345996.1 M18 family aminopeptidase [Pseudomonadales bacterium]
MDKQQFNTGLLAFIEASPTPFHAVETMTAMLEKAGFQPLDERDRWALQDGASYVVRRGGSLLAFRLGGDSLTDEGVHLAGAHTDSPGLKIKPVAERQSQGYLQLGVEVYGGALLNPWFDRDLSLAGKVSFLDRSGAVRTSLINFRRPIAVIPSLAIHLDREVNKNRSIDAQKHLPPVVMKLASGQEISFEAIVLEQLRTEHGLTDAERILSHELFLYDTQAPALVGLNNEFIASARLDNLLSCYLITRSLLDSSGRHTSVMVCNDHEEVGSASASGAQGPFLKSVLQRLVARQSTEADALERTCRNSLFLSIDNAHGVHPNYAELHDPAHGPGLNAGPVIKINANQRYASNTESVASFRAYCDRAGVQSQAFVMRSDLACGSTIGPITATETGIATVDVGVPTFAMHSIRELAGADDGEQLSRVVTAFYDRL